MLGLLGLMSWLLTSKKVLDKLAEMPYNIFIGWGNPVKNQQEENYYVH